MTHQEHDRKAAPGHADPDGSWRSTRTVLSAAFLLKGRRYQEVMYERLGILCPPR